MAMLTPKYKASHNFGFMSMINRLAGFLGPFIFSTLSFLYDAKTGFIGSRPPLPLRPSLSAFLTPPPPPLLTALRAWSAEHARAGWLVRGRLTMMAVCGAVYLTAN
jgi:hypothetical protein